MWNVTATRHVVGQLARMPKRVVLIYRVLVEDLKREGPRPYGWMVKQLKGRGEIAVRLNREYRVLIVAIGANLTIVKVAHRREVYK